MKPKFGSLKRSAKLTNLQLGAEEKEEKIQITKNRNEKEDFTTNLKEIKRSIKGYKNNINIYEGCTEKIQP